VVIFICSLTKLFSCIHGVWASSCLGGTVYFARTGKLSINIFPQNFWRAGGEVTKKIFPDILQKNFSGHTYNKHSTKFSRHSKKNSRNFRRYKIFFTTSKFFRNLYVLPEFRSDFFPTVKIWGGARAPPCPTGPYAYAYI
jgi:hypothetical protein